MNENNPISLSQETVENLRLKSAELRLKIIDSIYNAHSGHPGGSLSIAEILTYLYYFRMNVDASDPSNPERDRFVLSKGHCAPALYATLAMKGFFPEDELSYLRKTGHMLQGHPDRKHIPGIDMSSGSLGQGISAACGMAGISRASGLDYNVYVVLGDGELQEGQVWEAAMFAADKKLSKLCAFVDYNNLQITGSISEVMDLGDIESKFKAFGWNTIVVDGHDFYALDAAWLKYIVSEKPTVIICNTVKGKGVSFMENNFYWHGNPPSTEEYNQAVIELEAEIERLKHGGNQ